MKALGVKLKTIAQQVQLDRSVQPGARPFGPHNRFLAGRNAGHIISPHRNSRAAYETRDRCVESYHRIANQKLITKHCVKRGAVR